MSSSRRSTPARGNEFERWIRARYAATRGFTASVLLLSIADGKVDPISCSYVHVIGDEVRWADMRNMLDASGRQWHGVAIFAETAPGGGPVIDIVAKARLQERIDEITQNRMALNTAGLFDREGRAFRVDPIDASGS